MRRASASISEGAEPSLRAFLHSLESSRPAAASVTGIDVESVRTLGLSEFTIRASHAHGAPTVRISPDLPVCADCLAELCDPSNPRYRYPYINCTNCGPRHSVILKLPYDRGNTTMRDWAMDAYCADQYHDPADRRFHAQPVACPSCGPHYKLQAGDRLVTGDDAAIGGAAQLLNSGAILAVKGIGGYHLACDARNRDAVQALRTRKYRKEKPFALMAKNLDAARALLELSPEAETLLTSAARPIVLARARTHFPACLARE